MLEKETGKFILPGTSLSNLDEKKLWKVDITVNIGQNLSTGDIIGSVQESNAIKHYITIPYDTSGKVISIEKKDTFTITDTILTLEDEAGNKKNITMLQKWPIRVPRPVKHKFLPNKPLITGQRVIDSLFPIAKGGSACVPGGFGTGKTMTQHQIAKWSDADIIVYIGCGERGNEMTQVLDDFSKLIDPKTNLPLMERTILIANTSNMPVASREASLYTGLTIAEYYRDMGYDVAIMADSTSRWAEALRELSGRLEEMPAEEGFPSYLSSRISAFYERAGVCESISSKVGSISIIGAVSPQGGDFSEPVTQNTKRYIKCFLALDRNLSYARHFPAINWLTSYSEYVNDFSEYYWVNISPDFINTRNRILELLVKEDSYLEIVKLIGNDVIPDDQKLILEVARIIRLGFLQQDAFNKYDTCVPLIKQYKMMKIILYFYEKTRKLLSRKVPMTIIKKETIFEELIGIRYHTDNTDSTFDEKYIKLIDNFYNKLENYNS